MDDICRKYGLRPIELVDKPLFDVALGSLRRPLSEYTFANTFIWRTGEKLYWAPIEGHLCVFADGDDDLTMLYPPMGEGDLGRCLRRCFEIMDDYNARRLGRDRSRIEYVSDELLRRIGGAGLRAEPMGGDYVYDTARLIDLSGSELKSKRHARNRFLREHEARTEPFGTQHVEACLQLLRKWSVGHDDQAPDAEGPSGHTPRDTGISRDVIRHRRELDTLATEEALKHFEQLDLQGMVLWAGDELVGFTFGQPLSRTQSSIVIEKADRNVVGAAQYIFSEFCSRYWREYAECNAGDDWDIPSLAWTKASYRPIERLQKWTLRASQPALPRRVGSLESVAVRLASPADGAAIASLEQRAFTPEDAFNKEQVRYLLRSPHTIALVAEAKEGIVGWAVVLLRRHARGTSARLYSLAVDPDRRRRGVGEKLARSVLEQLETRGVGRCYLEVREDNAAAMRLYEGLGFRCVKALPDYYAEGVHGWRMLYTASVPAPIQAGEPLPVLSAAVR